MAMRRRERRIVLKPRSNRCRKDVSFSGSFSDIEEEDSLSVEVEIEDVLCSSDVDLIRCRLLPDATRFMDPMELLRFMLVSSEVRSSELLKYRLQWSCMMLPSSILSSAASSNRPAAITSKPDRPTECASLDAMILF